ncbi:hypothetical protein [uncultured Algibacter sp.]|uniref:hypothetical protein n=1 Tax=uncultured Algibacter sp. TaxID=298659 RepID=UPI0030ECC3CA
MNKTIIKLKLVALCFLITGSIMAQKKLTKVSQSIKVDKDVVVDLNTSYCNIVFDTWNKNTIEIEAYIEGEKLSKEALADALKQWNVDVDASSSKVSITTNRSQSSSLWVLNDSNHVDGHVRAILKELKYELAEMPEMPEMDFDFEMPEMPEMPELPELPEGVNAFKFDYEAYKKNGENYLEEWSQKFESKYGKEYAEKMEAWGEKFGKEWGEKFGEGYAKEMEKWGEKFGEEWGEKYGKQMEEWGERFAKRMESQAKRTETQSKRLEIEARRAEILAKRLEKKEELLIEKKERAEAIRVRAAEHKTREQALEHKKHIRERAVLIKDREKEIERLFDNNSHPNVKKTIKIKMPKGAKLKVNVRYGEIEFAANVDNLEADLSHAKFTAQSINGSLTSINASYSPIYVTNWNLGELNLNYVNNAELKNVKHIVLNSVSSNIDVENLFGSAIIDGNIGNLKIFNIDDNFISLNMILQNNDALIALPNVDYNLQYKGTRSHLKHPKQKENDYVSNFSAGNLESGKNIVINAKYSNVTMK